MNLRLATVCASLAIAPSAAAQAITFTGDVQVDFAGAPTFADPGGIDVGLPPSLAGETSGWDMNALAVSYDFVTDTLFVGIDTFGVCGDADGDGDGGSTSPGLASAGGTDVPDLGDTESVTFAIDLNGDGNLDIIAGIPFGSDINGYTVAQFQGSIFSPAFAFGPTLANNVGTVFASPSAAAPDFECTITNFSELTNQFALSAADSIGIHAFMGSLQDDGIGEDFTPGTFTLEVDVDLFPCLPIPERYEILSEVPVAGGIDLTTGFGLRDGYGCCVLLSTTDSKGLVVDELPGSPTILVGEVGLVVIDFGFPGGSGQAVECKQNLYFIPNSIPSGTTFFAQVVAYPNGPGDWFASNLIDFTQP